MSRRYPAKALAALAGLAVTSLCGFASANPHPLPFTYPYSTLGKGHAEIEEIVDLTPVRVARERLDGTQEGVIALRSELTTELEFGLTDRLELGLYFSFHQGATAGSPALQFQGIKQRLRYRFAEQGEWPVDLGVYLEVAEFYNELELEEKILLSKRIGRVTLASNLWIEQEYYFQDEETKYIYNPTVGAVFEISPNVMVGAEYWARGRFDDSDTAVADDGSTTEAVTTRHYLGPTLMLQSGEYWLSTGAYARLDRLGDSVRVGDTYGHFWFRMMVGFGLP